MQRIRDYFLTNHGSYSLSQISDGACLKEQQGFIALDDFFKWLQQEGFFRGGELAASCDTLLFSFQQNQLYFVEFKRFDAVSGEFAVWWERQTIQIYKKMAETLLVLAKFLKENVNIDYDFFFNLKKNFFLVYRDDGPRSRIKRHNRLRLKRYDYLFEKIQVMSSQTFLNQIQYAGLR